MKRDFGAGFRRIDKFIRRTLEISGVPGLAIGVTDRRKTLWTKAYGFSELESRTRVNQETLFEIGSISKFFSSLALMQLRDEGLVDVNRLVTDYLPWFRVKSRCGPIRIHHLLTHTAGLVTGQEESPEGLPEVWALRDTETGSSPGDHFHYSNHGYKTIGLVMERITGLQCGQLVKSRVLEPLGMTASDPVITNQTRTRLAVGYGPFFDDRPFAPRGRLAPATWFESGTADGTICSTAGDMCCYLRMLLNGGKGPHGRLVSEEGFALMTAPHVKPEDNFHGEAYGYGMNVGRLNGHSCLWHTGGMVGYHASIVADLDAGLGVVTMVNGPSAPEEASLFALRTLSATVERKKLPQVNIRNIADVERPGQYSGEYRSTDQRIRIESSGKSLYLVRGTSRSRLLPTGPDKFYDSAKGMGMFLVRFGRHAGTVVELFHGPDWYVNSKYRGQRTFHPNKNWEAFVGHYRSNSPWSSNFRVVLRKGQLALIEPQGDEEPMTPLKGGVFRLGADPRSPERIRFEMLVDGKAHMAVRSAGRYYRTFTP